jgi:virulence factor Mce-like protein
VIRRHWQWAVLALGALGVTAVALATGLGGGTDSSYRVDVIFDSAKGVVPGQQVKIAGALVGSVKNVSLTPDYKARMSLDVDPRFAPFHRNAKCALRPQALIGERFVQCDPGTPSAPQLRATKDFPPTVPVDRTTLPVGLSDIFAVLDVPASQRLSILLSSLGAGLSGRGQDLNGIFRRANPTLGQLRRVLTTLANQRAYVATAVTSSDRVLGAVAARNGEVRRLIHSSARIAGRLQRRRGSLTEAERRLPTTLTEARSTLAELDTTARTLTPVLRDTRAAAQPLDAALVRLPGFTRDALPALRRVGAASRSGAAAVPAVKRTTTLLRKFAADALPTGQSLGRTLVSLRDTGTLDGLIGFTYNIDAVLALHDDISHIGSSKIGPSLCLLDLNVACDSEPPPPGEKTESKSAPRSAPSHGPTPNAHRPTPEPAAPSQPAPPPAPAPQSTTSQQPTTPQLPPPPPLPKEIQIPGLPPVKVPDPLHKDGSSDPTKPLLDYLMK